ncbi:MAG: hypothetical protein PUC23_00460 [bacterium]|nr:hypothetical protein [bacterium]
MLETRKNDLKRFEEEYKGWKNKIKTAMKSHKAKMLDSECSDFEDLKLIFAFDNGQKIENIFNENEYLYERISDLIDVMKNTGFIITDFMGINNVMLIDNIKCFENGDYDYEDSRQREYFDLNNY